jgi:DNA-binding MarR family transcriptional regulator
VKLAKELEEIIKTLEEEEGERGLHFFSNRNRRNVFREITRAPCQTSSSVARKLGVDVQIVEWHLKRLVREGFVVERNLKKKVYYPKDLIREDDVPLFYLLNTKGGWTVVHSLFRKCRDLSFLQRHLSRATVYRVLRELRKLDLVEEMRGTRKLVCLKEDFYKMMEDYDKIGLDFRRKFIKSIEFRGYSIEIIGTYNYETKIRVRGVENFTLGIYISPLKSILGVRE